jgi:hypothetical protein
MSSPHGLEIYPIVHKERAYRLIAPEEIDMTFVEVRAMLDWLDARGAFSEESGGDEEGAAFLVDLPGVSIQVDVRGLDVLVIRRSER